MTLRQINNMRACGKASALAVLALCASTASGFVRPQAATALGRVLATSREAVQRYAIAEEDDDVFADIFAARDARRAAIKEKASEMAAALQLEVELVEADDEEGRALDAEIDDDDVEYYNAAELFKVS